MEHAVTHITGELKPVRVCYKAAGARAWQNVTITSPDTLPVFMIACDFARFEACIEEAPEWDDLWDYVADLKWRGFAIDVIDPR